MKEEKLYAVYDENETCIFVGEAAETAEYLGCRKNQIFSIRYFRDYRIMANTMEQMMWPGSTFMDGRHWRE